MSRNADAEVKVKARRPESSPFRAQESRLVYGMESSTLNEEKLSSSASKSAAHELSWSGPTFGRQIWSILYMIDQVLIPALAPTV